MKLPRILIILIFLYFNNLFSQTGCWKTVDTRYFSNIAIKNDGTLWTWGDNTWGQLGIGSYVTKKIPTQVGGSNQWNKVGAGDDQMFGIKNDGSLWAWGNNTYGELGDGTTTTRVFPTQIGTSTDWVFITSGISSSYGIKSNGTLWAWGRNHNGQLGIGSTTDQINPIQVGTETNWVKISTNNNQVFGLKSDGTLWEWGYYNSDGGNALYNSTPVRVGIDNNFVDISASIFHRLALKSDGTIWSWGIDAYGELGGPIPNTFTIPGQIGTMTNWSKICTGVNASYAIKNDGTLWVWGRNNYGQLGDGTYVNKSVPTQVGLMNDWTTILGAGYNHAIVKKNDGTLWAVGYNQYGQLGNGSSVIQQNNFTLVNCPASVLAINDFEFNQDKIKLYPNPISDNFIIETENYIENLYLYNSLGQKVKEFINSESYFIGELPSGIYILELKTKTNKLKVKIIKR